MTVALRDDNVIEVVLALGIVSVVALVIIVLAGGVFVLMKVRRSRRRKEADLEAQALALISAVQAATIHAWRRRRGRFLSATAIHFIRSVAVRTNSFVL